MFIKLCEIHSKSIKIVLSDLKTALFRTRIFARKVVVGGAGTSYPPPTHATTHPPAHEPPAHHPTHTPTMPDFTEGGIGESDFFLAVGQITKKIG